MKKGIKSQFKPAYVITGSLLAITGISGVVLRSTTVSADDVIDDVSITIPVSCSMSGNIDTAHTASMQPGSYSAATGSDYENGIGKTTLTTFCNDQNGFSIYAIGYTGNVDGDNTLVGTATSSYATIATGTNTSGGTSNWAMKVNKVENPAGGSPVTYNPENMTIVNSFNNYHAVPDEYTKVAEYHAQSGSSATDMGPTALGAKITTTYAAFISATQTADTYTGQVKYVLVHPYDAPAPGLITTSYTITYNDASGDGWDLPSSQSGTISTNTNVALSSDKPKRLGHTFDGWCSVNNSTNPTTCSGNTYLNDYPVVNTGGVITIPLYAIWRPIISPEPPTITSIEFEDHESEGGELVLTDDTEQLYGWNDLVINAQEERNISVLLPEDIIAELPEEIIDEYPNLFLDNQALLIGSYDETWGDATIEIELGQESSEDPIYILIAYDEWNIYLLTADGQGDGFTYTFTIPSSILEDIFNNYNGSAVLSIVKE